MTSKIAAQHLERRAYVYVRQSTMAQVFENTESTARQYALVERARALGWSDDAVEVIDEDLGRSGATGLAGGDHLHFTMMIGGHPVTAIDWWSEQWVEDRINRKLVEAGLAPTN